LLVAGLSAVSRKRDFQTPRVVDRIDYRICPARCRVGRGSSVTVDAGVQRLAAQVGQLNAAIGALCQKSVIE
jgi:hypothetical protein